MFNWTIISDMPRSITNGTDSVGTESITMSPVMTEIALIPKTSGGGMSRSRQVAVRARVGGAVLLIVTEIMTSKALCHGSCRSRSKFHRARKYLSGGGEHTSAIRETDMLGSISRNRKSSVVRIG